MTQKKTTRREHLQDLGVFVGALFIGGSFLPRTATAQEASSSELPNFQDYNDPVYNKYDETIKKEVDFLNSHFKNFPGYTPLDTMLVKSIIIQETGSPNDRESYTHDPMQIANEGDFGLSVLQESDIYKRLGLPDMSGEFIQFAHTPRIDNKWDFSGENAMTPEMSIKGGLIFLCYKLFKYGYDEKKDLISISGARTWKQAVARYNGGGTAGYENEVFERLNK